MPEEVKRRISASEKGKHISVETRKKMSEIMKGQTNDKCRNWKGDDVGYWGIHDWLATNYGKANKCENPECSGKSKNYQWAKKRDVPYKRIRGYFEMLCVSCHTKQDWNKDTRKKISESLKKYHRTKND